MTRAVKEMPQPYVRYHQGLTKVMKVIAPEHASLEGVRDAMPQVTYIFSSLSRTGKSAMSGTFPGPVYYVDKPTGQGTYWFDDYIPMYHQTVILEEFRGSDCTLDYLLRLLDRKPMRVQYKGGTVQFNSPHIVINTNIPHHKLYPKVFARFPHQVDALANRLSCVVAFTGFREYQVIKGVLPEGVHCPEISPPDNTRIVYPEASLTGLYDEQMYVAAALANRQEWMDRQRQPH